MSGPTDNSPKSLVVGGRVPLDGDVLEYDTAKGGWVAVTPSASASFVGASYYASSNAQSFGAGWTTLVLNTKVLDEHTDYNTTTGVFTVRTSGTYKINAAFATQGFSLAVGEQVAIRVSKNSATNVAYNGVPGTGGNIPITVAVGPIPIALVAGDTITFLIYVTAGTAAVDTSNPTTYFLIEKVA